MSNNKITHSMSHFFNVQVATDYNPNIAIFMSNIAHWTLQNLANERNIHDGRCWTYNTLKAFQIIFPYFSKKNLETIINKSIDAGLLIKGNYNKAKYDRTTWYAMTDEAIKYFPEVQNASERLLLPISQKGEMDFPEKGNGLPATGTPIPDINTNNKNIYIGRESKNDSSAIDTEVKNNNNRAPKWVIECISLWNAIADELELPPCNNNSTKEINYIAGQLSEVKKQYKEVHEKELTPEKFINAVKYGHKSGFKQLVEWKMEMQYLVRPKNFNPLVRHNINASKKIVNG